MGNFQLQSTTAIWWQWRQRWQIQLAVSYPHPLWTGNLSYWIHIADVKGSVYYSKTLSMLSLTCQKRVRDMLHYQCEACPWNDTLPVWSVSVTCYTTSVKRVRDMLLYQCEACSWHATRAISVERVCDMLHHQCEACPWHATLPEWSPWIKYRKDKSLQRHSMQWRHEYPVTSYLWRNV